MQKEGERFSPELLQAVKEKIEESNAVYKRLDDSFHFLKWHIEQELKKPENEATPWKILDKLPAPRGISDTLFAERKKRVIEEFASTKEEERIFLIRYMMSVLPNATPKGEAMFQRMKDGFV